MHQLTYDAGVPQRLYLYVRFSWLKECVSARAEAQFQAPGLTLAQRAKLPRRPGFDQRLQNFLLDGFFHG